MKLHYYYKNNFITAGIFAGLVMLLSCNSPNKSRQLSEDKSNWAEKLGFPAGKKVIMLHADDIGMCAEANEAAQPYLQNDYIQSAAVMMPCAYANEMITWAKNNPREDIGLHLTLTSEWKTWRWGPVTDVAEVPGLIDPDGKLWSDVPEVVQHASAEEVEKEVRAQIEAALAQGYRPSHIDTHMGTLYGHPDYIRVFFSVAQEYGIPANVIDVSNPEVRKEFMGQGYPINEEVMQMFSEYTLPMLDYFTSAPNGSTYAEKIENFKKLIRNLRPGLTEIIFHPSVETENLRTITNSWQQRVWEAKMFADPDLIQFFKEEGIVFTNWKDIMSRFEKNK